MSRPSMEPIVVGTDGSDICHRALVWAAAEAERARRPLVVVHALDVPRRLGRPAERTPALIESLAARGRSILDGARTLVERQHPGLAVSLVMQRSKPERLLVELGDSAYLLVTGSYGEGRLAGALLGSVSQYVAAHATCPIVVINDVTPRADTAPVVVGVADTACGLAALEFAFVHARRRGVPVHAVRAEETRRSKAVPGGGRTALGTVMQRALAIAESRHPDVEVQPILVAADRDEALLAHAESAGLLVVGCTHPERHHRSRLGSSAARLLHLSPCPIAIVTDTFS